MLKKLVPPHMKTILHILPVGVDCVSASRVTCECLQSHGENHLSVIYTKQYETTNKEIKADNH